MITTYDLVSFSKIEPGESAAQQPMHEAFPAVELRMQLAAETVAETREREFTAVVAAQTFAGRF